MAERYPITVDQGATLTFAVVYRNKETQVPYDISAWTPKMDVRTDFLDNQPTPEFSLTEGDGLDMTEANVGRITVTINATRTGALSAQTYKYDLEIVNGSDIKRLIYGTLEVKPQVTD